MTTEVQTETLREEMFRRNAESIEAHQNDDGQQGMYFRLMKRLSPNEIALWIEGEQQRLRDSGAKSGRQQTVEMCEAAGQVIGLMLICTAALGGPSAAARAAVISLIQLAAGRIIDGSISGSIQMETLEIRPDGERFGTMEGIWRDSLKNDQNR